MTYWRGAGSEIGQGFAQLATNLIGTTNALRQQQLAEQQQQADNAFRQQQANEQVRQFDAQAKQARDSQTYQYLAGQGQQLTQVLAKGGYAKGSPEFSAAQQGLAEIAKLQRRVLSGETLTQDDLTAFDSLIGNVGAVLGFGAQNIGDRAATAENTAIAAQQAGTTATVDANNRANEMQPFSVAGAGYQNRAQAVAANVAEGTRAAQIARPALENAALGVQLDTARFQLSDLQTKAPLVYEGMRLSNSTAQQALDFNTAANPERLASMRLTNEQTRQAIDQSGELFPYQKDLLRANLDLQEIQVQIAEGTKTGEIDGKNSQNWQTVAQAGNPALFDKYVKDGVMTEQQAAPYKRLAEAIARQRAAQVSAAESQATTAGVQARVQTGTEGAQISAAQSGAQEAASNAALAASNVRVAQGTETSRINTAASGATQAAADAAVAQGTVTPRINAANSAAQTAAADAAVAAGTVGPRISAAQSGASTAAAQATSAQAQAQVDVATIPAQIAARQLAPQQAQAALDAQLLENRFSSTTFADRVRAVNLQTSQGLQQLLAMKQQYSQNTTKFPAELQYLNAQIEVTRANAKEAAARVLAADGNGVTDKKTMVASLTQMRIINSQDVRTAQANLRNLTQRYLPNAKFSVDKYDSKSFTTLIASASNLSPEQQAELQTAQAALDTAQQTSTDLSQAFGQVSAKGRIDPKIAERLGIFTPGDTSNIDSSSPYGDTKVGNTSLITKFPGTAPIPRSFDQTARFEISRTAGRLGIDANALAAIISFETSGTFSPNARNGGSSATGLIQFMAGKGGTPGKYYGMTRDEFGKLSFAQQMPYVERYLREAGIGPGSTMADVYAAVTGSGYKRGSTAYEKNKVWDANKDGVIDKGEQVLSPAFQSHVRDYFGTAGKIGPAAPIGTAPAQTTVTQPVTQQTAPIDKPAAKPGANLPAVVPLAGLKLDQSAVAQLKGGYRTVLGVKDPAASKAKAVEVSSTIAAQLSSKYGQKITPAQVFEWMKANGGNL